MSVGWCSIPRSPGNVTVAPRPPPTENILRQKLKMSVREAPGGNIGLVFAQDEIECEILKLLVKLLAKRLSWVMPFMFEHQHVNVAVKGAV